MVQFNENYLSPEDARESEKEKEAVPAIKELMLALFKDPDKTKVDNKTEAVSFFCGAVIMANMKGLCSKFPMAVRLGASMELAFYAGCAKFISPEEAAAFGLQTCEMMEGIHGEDDN